MQSGQLHEPDDVAVGVLDSCDQLAATDIGDLLLRLCASVRFSRSDTGGVQNLAGWLTTIVARVSLDMLRSRKSRRAARLGELDLVILDD